jgi:hypothetical protein
MFCFLWIPLFYLFWRTLAKEEAGSGGVWALLLGSIVALVVFFVGDIVNPGGFGISRWLSACIDIVTLPVVLPLAVYFVLTLFKAFSGPLDFTNFTLLWLIPGGAIRAVGWSAGSDPGLLVLAPLLWTGIAVGVPFFINCILNHFRWYVIGPAGICILVLPFTGAACWWAFYSHKLSWGLLFLGITVIPMVVSLLLSWFRLKK